MRAMQVADFGAPLLLAEVPTPEPKRGEVRVSVHAAGVNFPDMLIISGRYQVRPEPPFSPGFEVAGVVSAVGSNAERFQVGDRVMGFALFGGYAEEVCIDEGAVFPLPDAVSYEHGAVTQIAYGTSYHALADRGTLTAGETLVVLGAAGGVGLAAVELGKLLGAKVIGAVGSDWKAEAVLEAGADHAINYIAEDMRERVKEITDGSGADVIYDPVGGDVTDLALRCIAWRGRLLVIGFTGGRISEIPANLLLLKGASAVGVFWGDFAERERESKERDFQWILDRIASGQLRPRISATFALEDAPEALELLAERRVVGKQVLVVR